MLTLNCYLSSLTTEGGVPPADGDSRALTGLSVCLHVVAQCRQHSVILTHVVDTVTQEGVGRHVRVAGLEAVREENFSTVSLIQLLFLCGAVGSDIWTSVWLTATEENVRMIHLRWNSEHVSPKDTINNF